MQQPIQNQAGKFNKKNKFSILTQNVLIGLRKIKLWWIFIILLLPVFAVLAALNPSPNGVPHGFKAKIVNEEVTLPLAVT